MRCWLVVCSGLLAHAATAQEVDLTDLPVSSVTIEGLQRVSEQLALNQLRLSVGDPYDPEVARADVRRLTRLGEFKFVDVVARVEPDLTVAVIYQVVEQDIVVEVQVVGNKVISDQDLLAVVRQYPGLARDDYLIEKAKRSIAELYREKGHYLTTVTVDEEELKNTGVLLFRVIEGPRVKLKSVEFQGCVAFTPTQLNREITTQGALPFIRKGILDEDVLAEDVVALDRFYKDRGFLDVRVDRLIQLSPNNKEAKVIFLIAEGRQFTLRSVSAVDLVTGESLEVFAPEQIAAMLEIHPGDVYGLDLIRKSIKVVEDAYGRLGYLDVRVRPYQVRSGEDPVVDLILEIDEGQWTKVGLVQVSGNTITRQKVIRRLVRLEPGQPFDAIEIEESRRRIRDTRLFNDVRITVQEPDAPESQYRDVLVEVKERNTGSVNFGVALGSDAGIFGQLSLNQDNFDFADWPHSPGELIKGTAFRGAGQRFSMALQPGNELFNYSVSWLEPHMFETDYSLGVAGAYRQRDYSDYTEQRVVGNVTVGRQLGDIWGVSLRPRIERVELTNIAANAPVDVYLDRGPDTLYGFGISLARTTIGPPTRPLRGSRLELSYDRVGGDFSYNIFGASYTVYLTLDEDFLGRKSTIRFKTQVGYISGGRAPTYERLYLGGQSFRGFEFRTISPKGIGALTLTPTDQPVGGNWLFFFGPQYEFPLFADSVRGVIFVDSGTVREEFGFEEYRVSIGAGVRLAIPFLGPVPIALDLAWPLLKEDLDQTQVFSFSAELPF